MSTAGDSTLLRYLLSLPSVPGVLGLQNQQGFCIRVLCHRTPGAVRRKWKKGEPAAVYLPLKALSQGSPIYPKP